MGGVTNHIKASMLHLLKDQRDLPVNALTFKCSKYTRENTGLTSVAATAHSSTYCYHVTFDAVARQLVCVIEMANSDE